MRFVKSPYLQLPETGGITVMWETDEPSEPSLLVWEAACPSCGSVRYSPKGDPRVFCGTARGTVHKVRAAELKEGTDYCYRAVSEAGGNRLAGEISVFRTQPGGCGEFSFSVTSETGGAGSPSEIVERLVAAVAAERPDFLLFAGDMVADGRRKQDWDTHLFSPFAALLSHTPFYLCVGNHEEHSGYMKQFLATPGQGYYDFVYGCAHFFVLDSTQLSEHVPSGDGDYSIELSRPLSGDEPQIRMLADGLQKSASPWKFVCMHYPPYFSGTWEAKSLRPLCRIFEEHSVDVVFTSHAIVYERSHPIRRDAADFANGVRYIVVGGAGAAPEWFHHKKAWHTAKSRAIPHFAHMSVAPGQAELQAVDLDGRVFDTLLLRKG
ncbi:MAG: metallophosphoesterase family protein [Clostridiales bacterium]|jgi:hypothetical protein|nr:metallophosphoesterase family protein [Clostridiales bacterium]